MSSPLGPLEIQCDAPPYQVVRGCDRFGFHAPLDVRWCRLSHHLSSPGPAAGALGMGPWALLLGTGQSWGKTCSCGQSVPVLEKFTFTFLSGRKADYLLGQCRWCHTMFWEEG